MKEAKKILSLSLGILIAIIFGYSAIMKVYAKSLELLIAGFVAGIALGGYLLYKYPSFGQYKKITSTKGYKENIKKPIWPYAVITVFVILPIIRYMIMYGIMSEAFLYFLGLIGLLTILPIIIKAIVYEIRR